MVKPPKSWLVEYAANKSKYKDGNQNSYKTNKSSNNNNDRQKNGTFGSNMDNSFRHYMARKIDLQRDQFGLVLPPTPDDDLREKESENESDK